MPSSSDPSLLFQEESPESRDDLRSYLAKIANPKAMVARIWDAKQKKFLASGVKVVAVDSSSLEQLQYSDAWVDENEDDVKVGVTTHVKIADLGKISAEVVKYETPGGGVREEYVLTIEKLLQLKCETAEECRAWEKGLEILKSVMGGRGTSSGGPGADGEAEDEEE